MKKSLIVLFIIGLLSSLLVSAVTDFNLPLDWILARNGTSVDANRNGIIDLSENSLLFAGHPVSFFASNESILNVNSSVWWSNMTGVSTPWFYRASNLLQFNETRLNSLFYNKTEVDTTTNNLQTNISNERISWLSSNTTQASLINAKANFANCPAGEIVQNTTAGGVQCVVNVAGSPYSAGLGLNLSGFTFNINLTYFLSLFYQKSEVYNKNEVDTTTNNLQTNITNAITVAVSDNTTQAGLIATLRADNTTQANLIANEISLQSANNITQANLIAGLIASNTTQATDIANLFNANTSLWNRIDSINATQRADNTTLGVLIATLRADNTTQGALIVNLGADNTTQASLIAGLGADNTTQATLVANEVVLQLANNNTQATLISNEVNLQAANNITQASLIAGEITLQNANNATQASLINNLVVNNSDANIRLNWSNLQNYPAQCPSGSFLVNVSDSVTCVSPTGDVYILITGYGFSANITAFNILYANKTTSEADNTTQASLITNQIILQAANNVTQGSLIVGLVASNTSQATDITNLYNTNVTHTADNITQATLIANEVSLQNANNATQASLIAGLRADNTTQATLIINLGTDNTTQATLIINLGTDNATQATLIANEVSLQNANNATQASLIAGLRADNTTQSILINGKASLTVDNSFTSNNTFNGETYFLGNVNMYNNSQSSFNSSILIKDPAGVIKGNWSYNPVTTFADFYTTGIIYEGGMFSLNTRYNDTALINSNNLTLGNLIATLRTDNTTQAVLIVNLGTDNTTQANLIAGLIASNTTQATDITNLFNANTSLWNRIDSINATQRADNTTLGALIATLRADNTTQGALIVNLGTDNTTQATLISNEVSLQSANNATQATLITNVDSRVTNINTTLNIGNLLRSFLNNNSFNTTNQGSLGQFLSLNGTQLTWTTVTQSAGGFSNGSDITVNNLTVNGTLLVDGVNISQYVKSDNITQGVLIVNLGTDNTTQASLIAGLRADNTTQASLISTLQTNITNLNTDNTTQASLIAGLRADNTTQSSLISTLQTNITNLNTDNTTQASLIANQVTLQAANNVTQGSLISTLQTNITNLNTDNTTQASLIAGLRADNTTQNNIFTTDNTTQASLINNRVQKAGDNMTGSLYINVASGVQNPLIIGGNNNTFLQLLITNSNILGSSDLWLGNSAGDNSSLFGVGLGFTGTNFTDPIYFNSTPANTSYIIFSNSSLNIVGGTAGKGINFGLEGFGLPKWIMNMTLNNIVMSTNLNMSGNLTIGTGSTLNFKIFNNGTQTNIQGQSPFVFNQTTTVKQLGIGNSTNSGMDRCTLSAGTCTISNTRVTVITNIFCYAQTTGGTPGFTGISARSAGVSYTVTGIATDTSIMACMLVEPNPSVI